jgi:hypothetical protein
MNEQQMSENSSFPHLRYTEIHSTLREILIQWMKI